MFDTGAYRNTVICTGAGVSAASGLRPFRGPGGIYETDPGLVEVSHVDRLPDGLGDLWEAWGPLRAVFAAAVPNAAHDAIARFQASRPGVTVITMNVDGLHQKAGTRDVVEIHGNLMDSQCADGCGTPEWLDPLYEGRVHRCPGCGGPARPAIVLFGEALPVEASWRAKRALRDVELFIAVGTSDTVTTGSRMAANARYAGARTVLVNLDHPGGYDLYDMVVTGRAEEILPGLLLV